MFAVLTGSDAASGTVVATGQGGVVAVAEAVAERGTAALEGTTGIAMDLLLKRWGALAIEGDVQSVIL